MSFVIYDLILLAIFSLIAIIFLVTHKKNSERHGIIFMHKTRWGINLIDRLSKKYRKILFPLRYFVILVGYFLMVVIVWFIVDNIYLYLRFPIAKTIKAPPLAPLIPYFPKLFGMSSMFPPLYFTYFIIAIGIGGILHEFSHGLFARIHGWKIKSTGFLFLGPLFGAFVEPDEKEIEKDKRAIPKLSMLAAGTFANFLIAVFFGIILWIFAFATMSVDGVGFNTYANKFVPVESISVLNQSGDYTQVLYNGSVFLVPSQILNLTLKENRSEIMIFYDSPAIRSNISGAIVEFDGEKIDSLITLSEVIKKHSPGDVVRVKYAEKNGLYDVNPKIKEVEIKLGELDGEAFLGIGIIQRPSRNKLGYLIMTGAGTYNPMLYYKNKLGDFGWFVYFLLWWVFLINVLLALFNMLPVSVLDGGRFLAISVAAIFRNEKIGERIFKLSTWLILFFLFLMMLKWGYYFFK